MPGSSAGREEEKRCAGRRRAAEALTVECGMRGEHRRMEG